MTDSPLTLSNAERDLLVQRSRRVCVVYPHHPMPRGVTPATARVGIESSDDHARLFVERGLEYSGDDGDVTAWLATGVRVFPGPTELLDWLAAAIPATCGSAHGSPAPRSSSVRPVPRRSDEVTDLDAVEVGEPDPSRIESADLEARLRKRVIGQDDQIATIASAVARHARKAFPRRPLTLMLIGPTGVGKTETANALADALEELDGQEWPFLRLDMTEYSERHAVSRLVGAPPGYVGYGDDSLATRLAAHPRHIVLFDEIDRAHPEVVTSLMNLMDAGRLDSARHGAVSAAQAVLIFTSNLGSEDLGRAPHDDADTVARNHLLRHGMAPELVARFGHVTVFGALDAAAMAAVAAKALCTVAADYGVVVEHVEPGYLSVVLTRVAGSRLGVRAIEHLVDAELGPDLAAHSGNRVAVGVDGALTRLPDEPRRDEDSALPPVERLPQMPPTRDEDAPPRSLVGR